MLQAVRFSDNFRLDPSLKISTFPVLHLDLCKVLLQNDERFPWLILVPRVFDVREIHHLSSDQRYVLMDEISRVSQVLQVYTKADKINTAAFGNITPQLHVHIIARFETDPFWPNPVIGIGDKVPYSEIERDEIIRDLQEALLKA
jgi:diadenosine tetraphosphate (Ap4A) HIT family hydrolase